MIVDIALGIALGYLLVRFAVPALILFCRLSLHILRHAFVGPWVRNLRTKRGKIAIAIWAGLALILGVSMTAWDTQTGFEVAVGTMLVPVVFMFFFAALLSPVCACVALVREALQ